MTSTPGSSGNLKAPPAGRRTPRPCPPARPPAWERKRPLGVVRLATLLLIVLGCGAPDAPEAGTPPALDEGAGGPPPETLGVVTETARPGITALHLPDSIFPHGEHRAVACATCHGRVAGHVTHAAVACTGCHTVPASFDLPTRPESECLACHHQEARFLGCDRCHTAGGPSDLIVETEFRVAGGAPRTRELSFDHAWHLGLECVACHESGTAQAEAIPCASCHAAHHVPTASCLSCHSPALERHDVQAHRGCAGSGCHEGTAITSLPLSRTVCLSCHAAQVEHMPGGECAACHRVAPAGPGADGGA